MSSAIARAGRPPSGATYPRSSWAAGTERHRPVVLASLDWIRPGDPRTGLGIASIASSLRHAEVAVTIVGDAVNRPGFSADAYISRVVDALQCAGPNAICGIAAFVWNEPEVVRLIEEVRANTDATVVMGGPQVSYVGAGGLESLYPSADFFVRGHGESAMVALATGADLDGLGVHPARTVDRGLRSDLDLGNLPSPHLDGTLPIGECVRWETQRGCPFACNFCQHREPGNRLKNRNLAEDRVLAEAHTFAAASVRRISVLDPIFHTKRDRAVRLLNEFRSLRLSAELSLQCRFELVDGAFLDAMAGLDVVLEFGLQTIHADEGRAVNRPNKIDRAEAVIGDLHRRGIPFEVSLIYGLPLQTLDSFRRSVDWCLDQGVPRVRAWPLMLLRGTPLFEQRARWGFVESTGDRIPIVLESHTFTQTEHGEMARIADELNGAAPSERLEAVAS